MEKQRSGLRKSSLRRLAYDHNVACLFESQRLRSGSSKDRVCQVGENQLRFKESEVNGERSRGGCRVGKFFGDGR